VTQAACIGERDREKAMPIERNLERGIFASRWLLAPFYVGLIGSLVLLLVKFVQEFLHLLPQVLDLSETEALLGVLTLVDLSLAANLLLMVIFAGYENFVSKIGAADHEDRPEWMGKIDYGGLKLKLVTSIVAISAIQLLKAFMNVGEISSDELAWMVGLHLTFVVSGVLLAWMDRLAPHGGGN
jgi:uncharacterized protein (TIGR00645 family)